MKKTEEERLVETIVWVQSLERLNFQETIDSARGIGFEVESEALMDAMEARKIELPEWMQAKVGDLAVVSGWTD